MGEHPTSASSPMVDVIMPVFNGQGYIVEAIRSVEQQTHRPIRLIVIDDGSTDNTAELVKQYQAVIPLDYIHQTNDGLSSARNAGIRTATAPFVAFLDADDVWRPQKLNAQINLFLSSEFNNLGLVYCDYSLIDQTGHPATGFQVAIDPTIRGSVFEKIISENKVVSSASGALVKRECFTRLGEFDEQLQALEDWDMWLRIAQKYEFDFVDQPLVKIRRHQTNLQNKTVTMFTSRIIFYNKWLNSLPPTVNIPIAWVKTVITKVCQRLPHRDFWNIVNQHLTGSARSRLQKAIKSRFKLYLVARLLLLPYSMLTNILLSHSGSI